MNTYVVVEGGSWSETLYIVNAESDKEALLYVSQFQIDATGSINMVDVRVKILDPHPGVVYDRYVGE